MRSRKWLRALNKSGSNSLGLRPGPTAALYVPLHDPRNQLGATSIRLSHRRDDEGIAPVGRTVGPALSDGLDLGPEADAFHAVLVDVAERTGTEGSRSLGLSRKALPQAIATPDIHKGIIAGR
jgi:hypothetical protein